MYEVCNAKHPIMEFIYCNKEKGHDGSHECPDNVFSEQVIHWEEYK